MKTRNILFISLFILFLAVAIIPTVVVSAQQPMPSDDEVNAIARQLYCPVCENTPLDVCPTTACHQCRELIRQMLAEGKSETEIKQYFVDYYGARVLSEPPRSGINWLVYIVPPVAFLAGVYMLLRAFLLWKKTTKESQIHTGALSNSDPADGSNPAENEEYIARLEQELKKRK